MMEGQNGDGDALDWLKFSCVRLASKFTRFYSALRTSTGCLCKDKEFLFVVVSKYF